MNSIETKYNLLNEAGKQKLNKFLTIYLGKTRDTHLV